MPSQPVGRGHRLAAALLALAAAACATTAADGADGPTRVTASMTILADFARAVGGDHVEVVSLVPAGGDPHTHEPTPADARAVADADLVLGNGVGLEPWFDQLAVGGREVLMVGDAAPVRVEDDRDGRPDPHLWMVPALAADYVTTIADALADLDPGNAADYRANADGYREELEALDEHVASTLEAIPEDRRVLVTPHDAYGYLAAAYDLEVATVVGVSTEEEPSAAAVRRLVDQVREQGIPTVFVETTVDRTVLERVAADAGVEVGRPLYGDSVGEPGSGAETYIGMMQANADALADGLAP